MSDNDAIKYLPMAGEDIRTSCCMAGRLASANGRPVSFVFNDTEMLARPGDTTQTLVDLFNVRRELMAAMRGKP